MLVDDRLVVIGSMNLDFLSMNWLEEGSLVVDDAPFAAEFERRWRIDLTRARQVTGHRLEAAAGLEGRGARSTRREGSFSSHDDTSRMPAAMPSFAASRFNASRAGFFRQVFVVQAERSKGRPD